MTSIEKVKELNANIWEKHLKLLRDDLLEYAGRFVKGDESKSYITDAVGGIITNLSKFVEDKPFELTTADNLNWIITHIKTFSAVFASAVGKSAIDDFNKTIMENIKRGAYNNPEFIAKETEKITNRKVKEALRKARKNLPNCTYREKHFKHYRKLCLKFTQPISAEMTFKKFGIKGSSIDGFIVQARKDARENESNLSNFKK